MKPKLLTEAQAQELLAARERTVLILSRQVPNLKDPLNLSGAYLQYFRVELDLAITDALRRGKRSFLCSPLTLFEQYALGYATESQAGVSGPALYCGGVEPFAGYFRAEGKDHRFGG